VTKGGVLQPLRRWTRVSWDFTDRSSFYLWNSCCSVFSDARHTMCIASPLKKLYALYMDLFT